MSVGQRPMWWRLMVISLISTTAYAAATDMFTWPSHVMRQSALPDFSVITIQSDSVFTTHSSQFQSQATSYLVHALKMIRKADPHLQVHISAYSDDIPNAIEQKRITSAQAEAVASYLWSQGVSYDRMKIRAMGSSKMIGGIHSSKSNAVNRRIEVILVPEAAPKQIYPYQE